MALRVPLSQAASGNAPIAIAKYGTSPFTVGTNIQAIHTAAGMDELCAEVANIDTASHLLQVAIYNPAVGIIVPDNVFYQPISPQTGLTRFMAGYPFLQGSALAMGVVGAGEINFLNVSGHANRIDPLDTSKRGLNGLTYNGSSWVANALNLPIKIDGTTAGAARTLYTPVAGTAQIDEVYLYLTNTSLSPVLVTICIGGTTAGYQIPVTVPPQNGLLPVLVGRSLNNALAVSAFAATANAVLALGWANRIS